MSAQRFDHEVVIIGSGFGGTMTALSLADAFQKQGRNKSIMILERGTWWTTPVGTVKDPEVKTYRFLKDRGEPVQFWPSVEHFKGIVDIFLRCVRKKTNPRGLYDMTTFGVKGLFGLGLAKNDGVSILHASGVGGGSLVYSNITIRPPELIFQHPRWNGLWTPGDRDRYYDLARDAIGYGVLFARGSRQAPPPVPPPAKPVTPPAKVNTGLSNISTRSARLDPHWKTKADPGNPRRGLKSIDPGPPGGNPPPTNALWIDRARVFQTAMAEIQADEYGTVDSAINDVAPENWEPLGSPSNYCERQGRCNVGCLPGARHTLNKQLMTAILGNPLDPKPTPLFTDLHLQPLTEVELIEPRSGGGYDVHYVQRSDKFLSSAKRGVYTAKTVIVSAGCVNTNMLLLRCQKKKTLQLSDTVGLGFSTNGDYLAFLEPTPMTVSLTRGPVTTSFGHFNVAASGANAKFHTIEDQGIPRALASVVGVGVPLLKSFTKGSRFLFLFKAAILWALKTIRSIFRNRDQRAEFFQSEDELCAKMMCVVAMGRDGADRRFELGGFGQTDLRVSRNGKRGFYRDPIYDEMNQTLARLARNLTGKPGSRFESPFLDQFKTIALTHPLGGCCMATTVADGVVDNCGRVFRNEPGAPTFYEGLYVADASIIPTALGVNPSLTISALALRIADCITGTPPPPLPPAPVVPKPMPSPGSTPPLGTPPPPLPSAPVAPEPTPDPAATPP